MALLATRQHGVVGRRQLLALGIAPDTIKGWLRAGRLHRLHREVFAVGHERVSQRGHWLAAVLACGDGAVLSHTSAATLWGLSRQRGSISDVTGLCGRQFRPGRDRIRLHRCQLRGDVRTSQAGIPVTTVARTLFDLAEVVAFSRLRRAWEEADRLGLLDLRAIELVCELGYGRRALRPIRPLLAGARTPLDGRTPLENRFLEFCRAHLADLDEPHANVSILGREVDAYWPGARLVVEMDSWEFHRHRAAFENDRARDAAFHAAGYRVIRLTHRRLEREPEAVARELRTLLATSAR